MKEIGNKYLFGVGAILFMGGSIYVLLTNDLSPISLWTPFTGGLLLTINGLLTDWPRNKKK